jgi:DNA-binding SARP family transcriptional activator
MAQLQLSLLGGFRLQLPSGRAASLPTQKVQALLAYLALPAGQPHPRDKLAALLWGDASDTRARQSLRHALAALRQGMPVVDSAVLLEEARTVALSRSAVEVDVDAFERLVAAGTPETLAGAAALYRGDFLAGLGVQEALFEEWLVTQRERLRELAGEALSRLLAHQVDAGMVDAAIQSAVRLVGLDPTLEAVHRTLMRLYARQGRRGAALRQYQRCVAALRHELGAEPEAETMQLYRELLPRTARPGAAAVPGALESEAAVVPGMPADALAAETPLIGRDAELRMLSAALDEARRGRGRLVTVLGEAGVGKSRLTIELAAEAARTAGVVLVGHSHESARVLPFGPWVDALRTGQVTADDALVDNLGPAYRAELSRLFPELGTVESEVPPERSARLFEAVAQLLARLAATAPLLVLLEDVHWADDMSLRLLAFLARRLPPSPVLLVATARDEGPPDAPLLGQVLEELDRESRLLKLPLRPLSRDDTTALVRTLARAGIAEAPLAELAERAWRVSDGNPLVVVETLRSLAPGYAAAVTGGLSLPERVRALIAARLDRLHPRIRELVAVAAVIGDEFDFALLHRAAGQDERAAAEGVEELVRWRVFQGLGERFEFTHGRVRAVAYDGLLEPRRRALHAAVGEALEDLYADRLEEVADHLAFHYARAEQADKAVRYLGRLAERSARAYAHAEAVAAVRDARRHAERLPAGPARDRTLVELALRQAQSLYFLGRFRESVDGLLVEEARLAALKDPALTGPWAFWVAFMCTRLNEHDRAVDYARQALEHAGRCGDAVTAGNAYSMLSVEAYWAGQGREAIAYGRQGVALLEAAGERWWLGMAQFYLGLCHLHLGDFEAALDAEARVLAIGEALDDSRLRSYGASATGWIRAARGDGAEAIEACRRGLDLALDPVNRTYAGAVLGYAFLEQGDHAQAIPMLAPAVEVLGRFGARQFQGWFTTVLAEAYRLSGQLGRARDLAAEGLGLTREAGNRYGVGWAQRALGRIARAEADPAGAEASLRDALASFGAIEARFELARTHLDLADLAAEGADAGAGATHLAEARALFAALGAPRYTERAEALAARHATLPGAG